MKFRYILLALMTITISVYGEYLPVTPVSRGGTGSNTSTGARSNLSAAKSGANSDITSLAAISTMDISGVSNSNLFVTGGITVFSGAPATASVLTSTTTTANRYGQLSANGIFKKAGTAVAIEPIYDVTDINQNVTALEIAPRINKTPGSGYFSSKALNINHFRSLATDTGAGTTGNMYGIQIQQGHNTSLSSANYTGLNAGIIMSLQNRSGSMTSMTGLTVSSLLGTTAGNYATVNTMICVNIGGTSVGASSGSGTGYIGNYYGIYHAGLDIRSTGTVGNKWAVYLAGTEPMYTGGAIGLGTTAPNAAAFLQIDSTSKGFLPSRMTTTQKNAISSPPEGLMVYDTDLHKLCVYTGSAWETVTSL